MSYRPILIACLIWTLSPTANAVPLNVAEGATVTLNGTYGVLRPGSGWTMNPVAAASSLTDGAQLPQATVWNDGSVWWDANEPSGASAGNTIEIDLGGSFDLIGFSVQADDNDAYRIEIWDGLVWVSAWDIPVVGGFGQQSRPDPSDPTAIFNLGAPVTTDRLRFSAVSGDGFYGVTEIRAFIDVSTPSTLALLSGLVVFGWRRRHRRSAQEEIV